jgi:formylglycine-generating enzyme required for sulfatase activity
VTNAQYALFVQDAKVKPPEQWRGGSVSPGLENHPVVNVRWDEAMSYCHWLGEKIEKLVSLPSEAEWERAARGDQDKRAYPWGNEWRDLHCNSSELGLDETTPVGLFLNGASPSGLLDMSGNGWEWTRTIRDDYFNYPYNIEDGRENIEVGLARVLRGGSFSHDAICARCAYRGGDDPYFKFTNLGFRVMVVSPRLFSHD